MLREENLNLSPPVLRKLIEEERGNLIWLKVKMRGMGPSV